jgi:hypothetical protein
VALQPQTYGPTDRVVLAFRAIEQVLKADPDFAGATRTWRTWTGDPDDASPPASAEMPWVRLTPIKGPMTMADEVSWDMNLHVRYELAVAGTNLDDLGNYAGMFRRALNFQREFQGDTIVGDFIRTSGAVAYELIDGAIAPIRQPQTDPLSSFSPPTDLLSTGVVLIRLFLPS